MSKRKTTRKSKGSKPFDKRSSGKSSSGNQRNLRQEILNVFIAQGAKALNYKQVCGALGITDGPVRTLIREILAEEVTKGRLKEVGTGKFALKNIPKETLIGRIQINRRGRGFVEVEGYDDEFILNPGDTGTAFWGDTVEIKIKSGSKKPLGRFVRVVERQRASYVGVVETNNDEMFVQPVSQRMHRDFTIPADRRAGATDGDKVIVSILKWDHPRDELEGAIIKVLGKPGDNDVEMNAIMAEFELPTDFPPQIEAAAEQIPGEITEKEISKRRDMRKVTTFTIDPHDAKDFDDALSIQRLKNGHWEVGVHIADVSHYLRPDTILDKEAYARATSVYLVDRTIPMLPEVLSNNLCSLRPDEEKLTFSAVFELDEDANLQNEWFGRTVTLSDRRFTYEEAQERIESGKGDQADMINVLDKLAKKMRSRRFKRGGIDFHSEEVKFNLDEDGKPLSVYIKHMKDANRLIEDFMLLANQQVSRFIGGVKENQKHEKTFIYRIHDAPDVEKLKTLQRFVARLGIRMDMPTEKNATSALRGLMRTIEDRPERELIQTMAIRSMAKAVYSTKNIGHFGLAFDYYSHFTSPIRRYPDVIAHRLLQHYLDGGKSVNAEDIERQCKHSSTREKMAQDAEWASIKYKQVEYLVDKVGEHFDGMISGLSRGGIYVELIESKCEGRVSTDSLDDDRYVFDEDRYELVGQNTGNVYRLGDKIEIQVAKANLLHRQLDFELIGRIKE